MRWVNVREALYCLDVALDFFVATKVVTHLAIWPLLEGVKIILTFLHLSANGLMEMLLMNLFCDGFVSFFFFQPYEHSQKLCL